MKTKHLNKIILFLTILVLITLTGYYVLFGIIKKKNILIADASLDLEVKAKQASAAESVKKVLSESEVEVLTINNYFIKVDEEVGFIEYLEGLAEKAGVFIVIQDLQEKESSDVSSNKASLHFKVAVEGTWRSVYRFLGSLEEIPYWIDVGYVELRENENGESLAKAQDNNQVEVGVGDWQGYFEFVVLKYK